MKYLLMILCSAFLLAGCIQTQATMLSGKEYRATSPESIVIYLTVDDIPGEFEKIAILNARGSSVWTNESQMYTALKKKAAAVGANGILFQAVNEATEGEKVAAAIFGTYTSRSAEMIAIFVR